MQAETKPTRLVVDEYEAAEALGLSVHTLRKDRVSGRRFPYYKVGSSIRYNIERLRESLAAFEQGGPAAPSARRR